MSDDGAALQPVDDLVRSLLARHPVRFVVADDEATRSAAFALRNRAVVEHGWEGHVDDAGLERDRYDVDAIHLLGLIGAEPVAAGRLVLPPGPLPTEQECGLAVAPAGRVVDVGRMVVAPSHRAWHRGAFAALLAALYVEMRRQGYEVATGMMARDVRGLARVLGLHLEVLGPDRPSHGEPRAPVRFCAQDSTASLHERWTSGDAG